MAAVLTPTMLRELAGEGSGPALAPPEATPLWLTDRPCPVLAWLHQPQGDLRGAAVLCPPLLGEHAAAGDLYRHVARSLAGRGFLVARFDYEGTGDSAGPPPDRAGRVAAWVDDVDRAATLVRARRPDVPLTLIGVRSGSLMAAAGAARRHDVDALVLWDPWSAGRKFLRRQRALHALRMEGATSSPDRVEVPGFVVDASTAEEIQALRISPELPVRRALVVVRPGEEPPPPVTLIGDALGGAPAEIVEAAPGEQDGCFDVDVLRRRLPLMTAASVVAWIDGAATLGGAVTLDGGADPTGRAVGQAVVIDAGSPGVGAAAGPVPADRLVTMPSSTAGAPAVCERAVRLGPHGLFGIETVPVLAADGPAPAGPAPAGPAPAGPARQGGPTAVLLSSGVDSHVGPSRIWVDLARRLAAIGIRSVRVDLSGLGESEPRPGRSPLVIRAPEAFDDVAEIVDAVGGAQRSVLVGLCSGAYQALESALELRPLAVVGVNPLLRFTPPELAEGKMASRRRLCEPRQAWVPSLRSRIPHPLTRTLVSVRRAWRRHRVGQGTTWVDELVDAGVGVYLVCGDEEARAIPALHPEPRGSLRAGRAHLEVIEGLDHALTVADQRDEVLERVTAYVEAVADEVRERCAP